MLRNIPHTQCLPSLYMEECVRRGWFPGYEEEERETLNNAHVHVFMSGYAFLRRYFGPNKSCMRFSSTITCQIWMRLGSIVGRIEHSLMVIFHEALRQ